jgi:hypothetical protein
VDLASPVEPSFTQLQLLVCIKYQADLLEGIGAGAAADLEAEGSLG